MKWKKLGKIFDPRDFKLANECIEFAQSPQAIVFEDFVRIYFSTRLLERVGGKYLSHIAYVDVSKNFHDIIAVSTHTVIELGKRGCFDEHGIFPLNVVRFGELIYGYTSGVNRRLSVPVDTAIGFVISRDNGMTFQRLGDGPVLSASLHEPCLVADPFVKFYQQKFHMWYIFGSGWKSYSIENVPDRIYKIGHATSVDGISWTKEEGRQVIESRLGADECQALPTVIEISNRYHMFFCYRHAHDFRRNRDRSYRIGHASSCDMVNWVRDDDELSIVVSENDWDSDMLCYPHVFECDDQVYLLYNGNEFGRHGFGLAVLEP